MTTHRYYRDLTKAVAHQLGVRRPEANRLVESKLVGPHAVVSTLRSGEVNAEWSAAQVAVRLIQAGNLELPSEQALVSMTWRDLHNLARDARSQVQCTREVQMIDGDELEGDRFVYLETRATLGLPPDPDDSLDDFEEYYQ